MTDAAEGAPAVPDGGAVDTIFGATVADPYRWLEDAQNPGVPRWVAEQDDKARAFLETLPHRSEIAASLAREGERPRWTTLPLPKAGKYLYSRQDKDHERGALYEYDPATKRETIIYDLNDAREDRNLVPTWWASSRDAAYAVFRMSPNGGDEVQARVFDVRKRRWLPERIADVRYSYPRWDAEAKGFYYTWSPSTPGLSADKRTAQSEIRYHRLNTSADADVRMREAPQQDGLIEVPLVTSDGRWLTVSRWYGTTRTALFLRDLRQPGSRWRQFTPDDGALYQTESGKDVVYVWTTQGAPHGHLFRVNPSRPEVANWKEIVPEQSQAILYDVTVVGDFLALAYKVDGEQQFEIHRSDGALVTKLAAPALGTIASVGGSPRIRDGAVSFCSYTQPYTPYIIKPPTFAFEPFPVGAPDKDESQYVTEKVFYTSPDGTRAPIYVVRSAQTPARQPAPLILSAYGGFGENTVPQYHRNLRAWLDSGGVYAEAVLRGGGEYGEAWHHQGMKQKRANVYADFIAASEFLTRERWTDPSKLVIRGASAGGLLVTVAMTERPELFAGVIAEVPLTDMIRYRIGGNGPLWVDEYGSPDNADEFPTLLRYSPYHRVRAGVHYPWLLMMSNAEDDRVNPMHARKFVAAIQAADPGGKALLRTERAASHGGAYTQASWVDTQADAFAFALAAVAAHALPSGP